MRYNELTTEAKQKALQEFIAYYEDVVWENERKADYKTERFALKWFADYGWFFYADGTRA